MPAVLEGLVRTSTLTVRTSRSPLRFRSSRRVMRSNSARLAQTRMNGEGRTPSCRVAALVPREST
jgi:hypothetical protein